jgi:uncharacterized membrane protein YvlD (DUF360 family)
MTQFLVSALTFAVGLVLLAGLLPGMRVRSFWGAFKASLVCGLLSAVLGKVLLVLLSLIFFLPILITGPLGVFVVQGLVNAILLGLASRIVEGVDFDRTRTVIWAAFALTLLQVIARHFA